MNTALRPRTLILFVGDLLSFTLALWLSLWLRAFEVPTWKLFIAHFTPFCLLFVAWIAVFTIAGLYDNRVILFGRRALSATLFAAQVFNVIIAALFFFFIPIFGIAPKTVLVIYLTTSFIVVFSWRAFIFPVVNRRKKEPALVVGEGKEIDELVAAISEAPRSPIGIIAAIVPGDDLTKRVDAAIDEHRPSFIIANWRDPRVSKAFPELSNLLYRGVRFLDAMSFYEEVFGRIPLSILNDEWLARHVSRYAHTLYDPLKRAMDIALALPAALLSLVAYPFIILAIKLDDGGSVFIKQERVGEGNKIVRIYKFRSMQRNDTNLTGDAHKENRVTAVGGLLRTTRLDELPQLWSVVTGQLSLIGPRPELPSGVAFYEKEIPYYSTRHLIKPGLSGWAQLYGEHAHHGVGLEETRNKLSHDLYYLKHRSLILDATVALKTLKKLLSRSGV